MKSSLVRLFIPMYAAFCRTFFLERKCRNVVIAFVVVVAIVIICPCFVYRHHNSGPCPSECTLDQLLTCHQRASGSLTGEENWKLSAIAQICQYFMGWKSCLTEMSCDINCIDYNSTMAFVQENDALDEERDKDDVQAVLSKLSTSALLESTLEGLDGYGLCDPVQPEPEDCLCGYSRLRMQCADEAAMHWRSPSSVACTAYQNFLLCLKREHSRCRRHFVDPLERIHSRLLERCFC